MPIHQSFPNICDQLLSNFDPVYQYLRYFDCFVSFQIKTKLQVHRNTEVNSGPISSSQAFAGFQQE